MKSHFASPFVNRLLLFPGAIPLLILLPRLLQIWHNSRLDQSDWIFAAAFGALFLHAVWRPDLHNRISGYSHHILFFLFLSLIGITLAQFMHIVTMLIFFCIMFWISSIWFFHGWEYCWRQLPLFALLLLALPGSTYWLSTFLSLPPRMVFLFKIGFAVLFFLCHIANRRHLIPIPCPETHFFCLGLFCSMIFLWQNTRLNIITAKFLPQFSSQAGEFWGISAPISPDTRRFFASSQVRQYFYLSPAHQQISVLQILLGSNIHEIHPASFCLKTSQWELHSEQFRQVNSNFYVNEITAVRKREKILVWVWYSNDIISTPSFLCFRKHLAHKQNWQIFQIAVPIREDVNEARLTLIDFINSLKKPGTP